MKEDCVPICLTPTRNEAWIIVPFVEAARQWASHVIVADQGSTDGTADKIRGMDGVTVVRNECVEYHENHRQKLLLSEARKIDGRRILIALDADEALSANFEGSTEWERVRAARPGTVLRFRWVNVLPGFERAWIPPQHTPFGFVDDGSAHSGKRIHSSRLPEPEGAPVMDFDDIVVLHFQYVVWERMLSKQRWYQAWEYLTYPDKGALRIYRQYNHMRGGWPKSELHSVRAEWLKGYDEARIGFRSLQCESVTWWDREILQMFDQHGTGRFRRVALWDKDWRATAAAAGMSRVEVSDPRSGFERLAHRLLAATQSHRAALPVRAFEKLLRLRGW
jgi:hypothetical protein